MATVPKILCAETIALLYLLHSVPALPSPNPVDSSLASQSTRYILPFEKELFLTSTLAFLSSIDDDPNHIPAVCVREDPDAGSLKVLIAVNEARWGDSHSILRSLKQGFERIFSILHLASPTVENDIFAAVVSMCSKRILSRLRLCGRKAPKQSIKSLLLISLRPFERTSSHFTQKAKHVIRLLDSWTKYQTQSQLQNVVQGIYELSQIEGLSELLDSISNREMDPTARKSLLNIVKKVARYRTSARLLNRIAKKFPIARTMEAVPITLPKSAFQRHEFSKIQPLGSFLKDSGVFHNTKKDQNQLFQLLHCGEPQASARFVKQTTKTLSEGKIHAEIQLVFHCEIKEYAPFPRTISSSKDACFLCNAFIRMHGKLHIPRSHGRLYPSWCLPTCLESMKLEQRFVDYLLVHVRNSMKLLISRRQRAVYPDPNESTVMTIPITSSTLSCEIPQRTAVISYQSSKVSNAPSVAGVVDEVIVTSGASHLDTGSKKSNHVSATSTSKTDEQVDQLPCSPVEMVPLKLHSEDLPFLQVVTVNQRPIQLSYGITTFLVEFNNVQNGRMFIMRQDTSYIATSALIDVLDIPVDHDLRIGCSRGASRFSICISASELLSFEFTWGETGVIACA